MTLANRHAPLLVFVLAAFVSCFTPSTAWAQTATVKGKVTFEGAKPKRVKLKMAAEKVCDETHKEPVYAEKTVIGGNGEVQWAFIHVAKGLDGKKFDAPSAAVTLDQSGCMYRPHVFGVMVGQPIDIVNSDPVLHNVHALPDANPQFNMGQPPKSPKMTKRFDAVEKAIKIKCDVHPWMAAYGFALDHPFFAVSAADGTYEIKGLPPGEYGISIWHEKWEAKGKMVTVAAGETKQLDFVLKAQSEPAADAGTAGEPAK